MEQLLPGTDERAAEGRGHGPHVEARFLDMWLFRAF